MPQPNRREVQTNDAPSPAFSYSQGIAVGDFLFIAGQVPKNPLTGEVPATFIEQARQALENLSAVALAGGTSLSNAVKVNVYLDDINSVHELETIYPDFFTVPFPVRTTVRVGLRGFLVEIDAIVAI
ncbi:MAG TPA: Rid family detoxifying hydrolase [Acidimicrobiales bacterium]|nr:Rid family detoxifying hydrolase [Acidimicrobiales bacterium]